MTSGVHTSVVYRERKVEGQFCPYKNMMMQCTSASGLKSFPSVYRGIFQREEEL